MRKSKRNSTTRKGIPWFIIIVSIMSVGQIFPLIWLLDFSLCKSSDLFSSGFLQWPQPFQWNNYYQAWVNGNYPHYLLNSLFVTSISIAVNIFLCITLGYAFTRMEWKLRNLFFTMIILGMMIPIHVTLAPNYLVFSRIGITDTYIGLILPYVAFSMALGVFVMSGFLKTIPRSIEESAVIDGCSIFRIIFQIILPMTKPAITTISILTFFNCWNEFIMAATFLSDEKYRTLPFSIMNFAGAYSSNYSAQFAVMFLAAFPALILYLIFNKHITKGATMGAIKG